MFNSQEVGKVEGEPYKRILFKAAAKARLAAAVATEVATQVEDNGVLRDTPVTPYTRPPISTDLAIKKTNYEIVTCRNLRQLTIFHDILLYSAKSTKFC